MHSQCQGCAEHIKESEWGESCAHPQVHLHPCHHDPYKRRQAFAETSPRLWRFPLHVSSKLNGVPWPCGEIALTRPQRDRKRLAFHNISKGLLYDPAVTYPCCTRTRTQGQDSSVPLFQHAAALLPETKPRSGFFFDSSARAVCELLQFDWTPCWSSELELFRRRGWLLSL